MYAVIDLKKMWNTNVSKFSAGFWMLSYFIFKNIFKKR